MKEKTSQARPVSPMQQQQKEIVTESWKRKMTPGNAQTTNKLFFFSSTYVDCGPKQARLVPSSSSVSSVRPSVRPSDCRGVFTFLTF